MGASAGKESILPLSFLGTPEKVMLKGSFIYPTYIHKYLH